MSWRELTDEEWEIIALHLPIGIAFGRPRRDERQVLNSILFVLATGSTWAELDKDPQRFVGRATAHRYFKKWTEQGVFHRLLKALKKRLPHSPVYYLDSTLAEAMRGGPCREGKNALGKQNIVGCR